MEFEQKVKSMTAKEIIMAMVDALTHPPIINIEMGTFGSCEIKRKKFLGITYKKEYTCFGCAATNTICQISGVVFVNDKIDSLYDRAQSINCRDAAFLKVFENAIDSLRTTSIEGYNYYATCGRFARITEKPDLELITLSNNYTNDDLKGYIELAKYQHIVE